MSLPVCSNWRNMAGHESSLYMPVSTPILSEVSLVNSTEGRLLLCNLDQGRPGVCFYNIDPFLCVMIGLPIWNVRGSLNVFSLWSCLQYLFTVALPIRMQTLWRQRQFLPCSALYPSHLAQCLAQNMDKLHCCQMKDWSQYLFSNKVL